MSDASGETKHSDGGPAFPGIEWQDGHGNCTRHVQNDRSVGYVAHNQGMSLRDWFAGMAMSGGMADSSYMADAHSRAITAYEVADAMLIARSPDK